MYEDRFDLYTLKSQLIGEKSSDYDETYSWWKKLTLRKYECVTFIKLCCDKPFLYICKMLQGIKSLDRVVCFLYSFPHE